MLRELLGEHRGRQYVFYLDVSVEETLRRHEGRRLRSEVTRTVAGMVRASGPARGHRRNRDPGSPDDVKARCCAPFASESVPSTRGSQAMGPDPLTRTRDRS
jgi:hypothetical protein